MKLLPMDRIPHSPINQICLDILRAALTREDLVLLSDILDGLLGEGEGPGLGSSPSCPLVASFNA